MVLRAVIGLVITVAVLAFAGKRLWYLVSVARSGKPAVGRLVDPTARVTAEATEVLGQRKLLKWTVPGLAHVFAFWGFLVLGLTILEAYGALFISDFGVPIVGTWPVIGFLEDLFGLLVLIGIVIFAILRLTNNPAIDVTPTWSPTGTQIAFASDRRGPGQPQIFTVSVDGSNLRQISFESYADRPTWSPAP